MNPLQLLFLGGLGYWLWKSGAFASATAVGAPLANAPSDGTRPAGLPPHAHQAPPSSGWRYPGQLAVHIAPGMDAAGLVASLGAQILPPNDQLVGPGWQLWQVPVGREEEILGVLWTRSEIADAFWFGPPPPA